MSVKTEKLLALYRVYEGLVRAEGEDVLATEEALPEQQSNQMRLIRQIRNFLSHNQAPGFVEPTDKMIMFLEEQVRNWTMRGDVVRKHLKTPAAGMCSASDTCAAALRKMSRLKVTRLAVMDDKGGIRLAGLFETAARLAADPQAVLADMPPLKEKPVYVAPDTAMADVDTARVNICTKDGSPDGRIMGIVAVHPT